MITVYNALVGALGAEDGQMAYRFFAGAYAPGVRTLDDKAISFVKQDIFDNDDKYPQFGLADRRIICLAQHINADWSWTFNLPSHCRSEEARAIVEEEIKRRYYRDKFRFEAGY